MTNLLPVHYKNSPSVVEKERLQCDKKHHEKPTASIKLKSEGLNAFPQDQEQGTDVHYHHDCIGGPGQYNKEKNILRLKRKNFVYSQKTLLCTQKILKTTKTAARIGEFSKNHKIQVNKQKLIIYSTLTRNN